MLRTKALTIMTIVDNANVVVHYFVAMDVLIRITFRVWILLWILLTLQKENGSAHRVKCGTRLAPSSKKLGTRNMIFSFQLVFENITKAWLLEREAFTSRLWPIFELELMAEVNGKAGQSKNILPDNSMQRAN
jgi:hypothetical protein